MTNECPVCMKDDQVRKVSAIVASDQRSGSSTSKTVGIAGVGDDLAIGGATTKRKDESSTLLAISLTPPPKPKPERVIGPVFFMGGGLLIVITIVNILGSLQNIGRQSFWIVLSAIWIILFVMRSRSMRRREDEIKTAELPKWNDKISRWNRLYYCYRDDAVFDPDTKQHVPPSEIGNLLVG